MGDDIRELPPRNLNNTQAHAHLNPTPIVEQQTAVRVGHVYVLLTAGAITSALLQFKTVEAVLLLAPARYARNTAVRRSLCVPTVFFMEVLSLHHKQIFLNASVMEKKTIDLCALEGLSF